MSFSMLEPEEEPICECRYDAARDVMDREDCPFHCDLVDDGGDAEVSVERKRPEMLAEELDEHAA